MIKLLNVWRPLSLLIFAAAALLGWQSVSRFQDAAAAATPVPAAKALAADGTVTLDDTLVFDLAQAGLGQDNVMGLKGEEYAVIPAHPASDTSRTLILLSSDPRHLGPAVNAFLEHQSASLDDQNLQVKADKDAGKAKLEARALIQQLGERLKDHLKDTTLRREAVRGTGRPREATDFPQVELAAPRVLAIRAGYAPGFATAGTLAAAALLLASLNALLWRLDRRLRREREEREAELPPEAPLV